MQTVRPLFENILVKVLEKKKQTKGGILLPDDKTQGEQIEGEVVAIGDGDILPVTISGIGGSNHLAKKPMVVKVGEHVVFKRFVSTEVKPNGEKYLLVNQRDLLAVIDY